MNNGSFSGGKIVWLSGSLFPVFMENRVLRGTNHLARFFEYCLSLCRTERHAAIFLGKLFPKMPEWTRNVLASGCAVILCLSFALLSPAIGTSMDSLFTPYGFFHNAKNLAHQQVFGLPFRL